MEKITSPTNERTLVPVILPYSGAGDSINLILTEDRASDYCLYQSLNAIVVDFIARQKIGGVNFNFFPLKQLPILPPAAYVAPCPWEPSVGTIADWIKPRVLELVYTSHSLAPFARDLGYDGPPFAWDPERRFSLRCELDAAFFHLYGIARDDVDYIMETFPIVKRKDLDAHGEYRTKRVILQRYDEYAAATARNDPEAFKLESGAPRAVSQGDYPPLPALLTLHGLLEYLSRLGVQVDNKRALGGGLWVYRSRAEFGRLAEHLQKSGVDVRYYPDGRKKVPGEQYELDPGKRLG